MKVVLLHGKDTDPSQKWYPWFSSQAITHGYEYIAPVLPNADEPNIDEWKKELEKISIDSNTVLIGHSRGGVAILRWLEDCLPEIRVKKIILIATNSGYASKRAIPNESNHGFYTKSGYDYDKIRQHCDNFVVMHSKDDEWVPYDHGVEIASNLNAKLLTFNDKGHFGRKIKELPELVEELKES